MKSDSLSTMSGYGVDEEDVEIEMSRPVAEQDLEPAVTILNNRVIERNERSRDTTRN